MSDETGLFIDYGYCLGCSECETACMNEHGFGPNELGIKVIKLGPLATKDGSWWYDFVPIPTDWCDLCKDRVSKGARPACVRHCQYGVLTYGRVDDLADMMMRKGKTIIIRPRCSHDAQA